jgi:hypothetical protein
MDGDRAVTFSNSVFVFDAFGAAPFSQAAQQNRDWAVSVWLAAETGEELLNDFSEAQMLTAGVSCGEDSYE